MHRTLSFPKTQADLDAMYADLVTVYLDTNEMSEEQWRTHMQDEGFVAWLKANGYGAPGRS